MVGGFRCRFLFQNKRVRYKIIAVEAEGAPALAESLKADRLVRLDKIDLRMV
ncbi:MAG: hypothetical protein IPJ13_00150 [Saprospiraceae bacterium]|nr:hypothetical protein [Saprospiraceae bacterium]